VLVDASAGDIGETGHAFRRLCTIGKALGFGEEPLILISLRSLIVHLEPKVLECIGRTSVVPIFEHRAAGALVRIVVASRPHAVPVILIPGETESKFDVRPLSSQDSESEVSVEVELPRLVLRVSVNVQGHVIICDQVRRY